MPRRSVGVSSRIFENLVDQIRGPSLGMPEDYNQSRRGVFFSVSTAKLSLDLPDGQSRYAIILPLVTASLFMIFMVREVSPPFFMHNYPLCFPMTTGSVPDVVMTVSGMASFSSVFMSRL